MALYAPMFYRICTNFFFITGTTTCSEPKPIERLPPWMELTMGSMVGAMLVPTAHLLGFQDLKFKQCVTVLIAI